jgi:hypothetical protein
MSDGDMVAQKPIFVHAAASFDVLQDTVEGDGVAVDVSEEGDTGVRCLGRTGHFDGY